MKRGKSTAFTDGDYVIKAAPEPPTESMTVTEPVYVIQDVPVPRRGGRKGILSYPIGLLKAGSNESFYVPVLEPATPDAVKKITGSIRTYAYRNDFKVILRAEAGGVRVWRKK